MAPIINAIIAARILGFSEISIDPELSMKIAGKIIAGNIAPLGWLEAVRKALNLNHIEETLRYG